MPLHTVITVFALNGFLFYGMQYGNEHIVNIANFIIGISVVFVLLAQFISDKDLRNAKEKSKSYKVVAYGILGGTIVHLVYWGYHWSATIWLFGVGIILLRHYHLKQSKDGDKPAVNE